MQAIPLEVQRLKAIVFDLDNTLVSSNMDFQWLRHQLGCPLDQDLLAFVDDIHCPQQSSQASKMILQHEIDDAQSSHPMPGCHPILEYIKTNALFTAVITRNCAVAAAQKLDHNRLSIETVISREHFPPKPAPDSLLALTEKWSIEPQEMLYVGDYLYDLQAASNAGAPSCLVTNGKESAFEKHASLTVPTLHDLLSVLRTDPTV
ncbi:HAD family hydrolase [Vibrio sonorensis]|uniref:HAD family hydrolase n=1 Tax=Vibrio sonorensis TaxID=1004316 RepID=UPI0008DB1578|nr:HAD family hydrolase [Vibrio sonorensis]